MRRMEKVGFADSEPAGQKLQLNARWFAGLFEVVIVSKG